MKHAVIFWAIALAAGLAPSLPAAAVTQSRNQIQIGANACMLSIPTTDTKVRPKATGFRNEGATNAFVICAFDTPPGGYSGLTDYSRIFIVLKSLDGASHDVTCTGVNSAADGGLVGFSAQQYVAKTVAVNDTGEAGTFGVPVYWYPEDFGAAPDTTIPYSGGLFSITCKLPPQVSVKYVFADTKEDVGS
jgi:hypothetical protein